MDSEGYSAVRERILTIVPQFSVVGLLLEHGEVNRVVKSTGSGLWQHDPFTWQLMGREFLAAEGLTPESRRIEKTLRAWVAEMSCAERRDLVEALYKAFTVNHAETLSDIAADKLDFIKSLGKLDEKTRNVIFSMGKLLLREGCAWRARSARRRKKRRRKLQRIFAPACQRRRKMKLLVSACLLGAACRYDGCAKPMPEIQKLMARHILIPVCPEIFGGMSTPRPPCELVGGKVLTRAGADMTAFL